MKIAANWRTALLAGVWTGVGALLFEALVIRGGVEPEFRPYYFFFGAIPFFWIPTFLFVFGKSTSGFTKHVAEAIGRSLCWMAGAFLMLVSGQPLVASLYAS